MVKGMENWFSGLPWPIRWAFIGGGALLGTFADKLTPWLQDAGLYAGIAFLAYGMFATLWHVLKERGFSLLPSLLISSGVFLIIAGIALHVMRLSDPPNEAAGASPDKSAAETKKSKPKTMRFAHGQDVDFLNLLPFDFPNASFHASERLERGQFVTAPFATFIIMYPNHVRAEFYVILIPKNANAYGISKFFADNYEQLRSEHGGNKTDLDWKPPKGASKDQIMSFLGQKVPFTGQIYIYHEPKLTDSQIKELESLFKEKNVIVYFRGPEHVAQMWADHGPRKEK